MSGLMGGTIVAGAAVTTFVCAVDLITERALARRTGQRVPRAWRAAALARSARAWLRRRPWTTRSGRRRIGATTLAIGGPAVTLALLPAGRDLVLLPSAAGSLLAISALAAARLAGLVSPPASAVFAPRVVRRRSTNDAALALTVLVVLAAAAAAAAIACGSADLEAISRAQATVSSWVLLHQPLAALLFGVAMTGAGAASTTAVLSIRAARADLSTRLARAAVALLGAHLFLGSWHPGVSLPATALGTAISTAVLALKAGLLVVAVDFLRWRVPDLRSDRVASLCWRWVVPTAFANLALAALLAPAPGGTT